MKMEDTLAGIGYKKVIILMLLIHFNIFSVFTAFAQWQQTGPFGGSVLSFAVSGANIFAGTNGGGVFFSTNDGSDWTAVNDCLSNRYVYSLTVSGSVIYAGTSEGIFRSTDNGATWTAINNGLSTTIVYTLTISGTNIFAGTGTGVFLSTDDGNTWINVSNGLPNYAVRSIILSGTNIFAGTDGGGVYKSTDDGDSWDNVGNGLTNTHVKSFGISGYYIFAGTEDGVFRSSNNGNSWMNVSSNLQNLTVSSLAISGTDIFAGTNSGVYFSNNNGSSWMQMDMGLTSLSINSLAFNGTNIFAGTATGVFRSANYGNSWQAVDNGLVSTNIRSIAISDTYIFTGTSDGIFLSSDNAGTWTAINNGLTNTNTYSLAICGTNIFAGTGSGVFLSTDNGTEWVKVSNGLPDCSVYSLAINGTTLFAGTDNHGLYKSTDNGNTWSALYMGVTGTSINSLAISGTTIIAGTGAGVFLTIDDGNTWIDISIGLPNYDIRSTAIGNTTFFAGTDGDGVFKSANNGDSWMNVNSGLTNLAIRSFVISGTTIFAGTNGGGVFLSINNGITWTAFNDGWLNTCVLSLALNGTDLFAATVGGGVWKRSVSNLVPKNFDAAVYQLLSPTDAGVGSASVISAKIDNTGLNPIGNFPVSCYVDGNLFATSIINSTIASMGSLDFIFPGTIDLSSRGEHTIKIIAGLTNDQNHANDTLITGIFASGTTVTAIGETYYDLQTNASCQNRLVRFSDGTTGGTWTMGTLYPGFPDRGTGYNSQQNSAWSSFPTDRIENVRTGWPSYAPWGSNGEIICAHTNTTNGLRISSRTTKGSGSWITANKPGPAGHEILNWPRMVTSGTNHDYLHIVALTIPVSSGGTLYNGQNSALLYSRSPDGGVTWDINNVQLPQTDTNFYYALVGDNCSFTAKGNTLAFVYGSTWTDVFLLKSTDNGTTWIKTLIFQNPYPKFTETTTLVTDTFTGCDGSLSVCLDANGIAHVFFGIRKTLNNNLSDGVTSYFSNSDGLAYWNETMPAFTTLDYQSLKDQNKLVGYVQDLNGNGIVKEFDGEGNYYSSLTSTPVSCIDNSGYIYVVFSSVMEGLSNGWQSYRQLWVRRSNNGGLTWGDFIRLNSTVGNSYSECVFPSLAENSDNNLYLLYQSDPEPGMAVTGDMDPFGVNTINVMTIPKTLFASPKIRTTLETVTGCPGNIAVKISVTNLSNVSSISLSFYYNNSILTYQGYQDLNPALASGTLLINPLANKINLAWFSLTPISISNGVLLEIKFSGNSGVSQLTWDSITPGACYFTDPVGNPLQANYTDGALNIGTCTHIMGNISYFNTSNTNISNTNLLLKKNNSTIATTTTNSSGQYHFTGISQTGAVNISVHCTKTWGGVNAIDALKAMQHFVGISPLTGLRLACADVDGNGFVNAADALLIMRRFVGLQISFASGDWIFENPAITIIPNDTVYQDIKGLCVGDIDCSYVPAARETPLCYIDPHGSYPLLPGKTLEVPVNIGQDAVLGSVSLIMKIPEGIVINDVQPELRGEFIFNVIGNELRIAWYSIESQILKSNDLLFTMIIRQEKLTESWVALPGSILADPMGNGLVSFPLWIPEASPVSGKNWLGDNSPNPFSEITSIPFGLCEVSDICLIISNLTGEEVSLTNLDHVPAGMHAIDFHKSLVKPGVYFYTLEIKTAKSYWKSTKRMIVR